MNYIDLHYSWELCSKESLERAYKALPETSRLDDEVYADVQYCGHPRYDIMLDLLVTHHLGNVYMQWGVQDFTTEVSGINGLDNLSFNDDKDEE